MDFLQRVGTNHLKVCGIRKDPNSQGILKKKTIAGGITMPDFRLDYTAVVIKTVWSWHRNRRPSF